MTEYLLDKVEKTHVILFFLDLFFFHFHIACIFYLLKNFLVCNSSGQPIQYEDNSLWYWVLWPASWIWRQKSVIDWESKNIKLFGNCIFFTYSDYRILLFPCIVATKVCYLLDKSWCFLAKNFTLLNLYIHAHVIRVFGIISSNLYWLEASKYFLCGDQSSILTGSLNPRPKNLTRMQP